MNCFENVLYVGGGNHISDMGKFLMFTANGEKFPKQFETLNEALEKVAELRKRYENISIQDQGKRFNTDLLEAIELGFLLDLAEVTVIACRERRESRGAHLREDYTERDDKKFMVHSMVYKQEKIEKNTGTNMRIGWKPVVVTNYQPMERKY